MSEYVNLRLANMIIEETQDGELQYNDPLSKGIVLFPENNEELKAIEYFLTSEGKVRLNKLIEDESI